MHSFCSGVPHAGSLLQGFSVLPPSPTNSGQSEREKWPRPRGLEFVGGNVPQDFLLKISFCGATEPACCARALQMPQWLGGGAALDSE